MIRPPWDVSVADVPERAVGRAALLLTVGRGDGFRALALDPEPGEWAAPPAIPQGSGVRPLALSTDGTRLLLLGPRRAGPRLCVHTLATGSETWLDASADGRYNAAALSPDGRFVAALATSGGFNSVGSAIVGTVDVTTGTRRRLWSATGGWSAESIVSWSPDGGAIAATYLTEDEEVATVVLDPAGRMLTLLDECGMLRSPNGSWTADGRIVVEDEETGAIVAVQPESGDRKVLAENPGGVVRAVLGNRLIRGNSSADRSTFVTTALDGSDQRPLLTLRPRTSVDVLDAAPALLAF